MNRLQYWFGCIIALPLLPIMIIQGKYIRKRVPVLPEAREPWGSIEGYGNKRLNLLSIGESTMAGVGVDMHNEGFTGTLAADLAIKLESNIDWKVYAKSGYTVKEIKDHIIADIEEEYVDLIVIGIGGNDAFSLNRPSRWKKQVSQMVYAIRKKYADTPIVFANMPPIKEFPAFTPLIQFVIGNLVEILGEELEKLTAQMQDVHYHSQKIALADWINRFDEAHEVTDFFSDGVHPSKLTYQLWASDLANYIMNQPELAKKLLG